MMDRYDDRWCYERLESKLYMIEIRKNLRFVCKKFRGFLWKTALITPLRVLSEKLSEPNAI